MSFIIGSERDEKHISDSFIYFAGAKFNLVQNGNSPNRYIWLHGDEQTARMALDYHIKHFAGLAFFIQNETREIPFKSTIVDPNRIFSRNGSYHALKKFKPGWQRGTLKQALDEIDSERISFLDILMPGGNGEKRSQRTSIKPGQNPRDFIICTNEKDFEKLSTGPYNVVLQSKIPEKDDGSLSWEALRRNIRYLNVETRLGYLTKQKKMLRFIETTLN